MTVMLFGLLLRRFEVFYCATCVFTDYQIVKYRCNYPISEERREELWNQAHDRNSKFLCDRFVRLEGLWVKLGQYLSSRADVMPEAYLKSLSKCQDSLPPRPFAQVRELVEAEFKAPIESIFSSVDEVPIACASIAQVHRGRLKDGRQVVLKIQHADVAECMRQDLLNLQTLGDVFKAFDPDFDFSPVIREWASEVPKELDFCNEAKNMKRVQANIAPMLPGNSADASLAFDVSLPQVVEEYVTDKVLVMSYVDGFKIDNKALLDKFDVDRLSLVTSITRAFAHQIFVDGFYSADPHPGNLMVELGSRKPVLLDFGLTKHMTEEVRYNFAKLLVAAAEQDIHGMIDALDGVGLKLRPDVPFDIALLARYFFRDANRQQVAQQESRQRREDYKKGAEERLKSLYVGDKVDVSRRSWPFRSTSKGQVVGVPPQHDKADRDFSVRLTDGSVCLSKRSEISLQKSRSPIDAWPDAFIFFDRVLGLLRGLTASLDVSTSYIEVMTPYARKALADFSATTSPANLADCDPLSRDVRGSDGLGGRVAATIQALVDSGDILGCQVCVIRNGNAIVDLAAGVLSPYASTPTARDSLFNCFSVSKGVVAAAIHLLVESGELCLDDPVCKYWPEFAQQGKERITIAHVLNHQAGLADAGLDELADDPYLVGDSDAVLSIVAAARPKTEPGEATQYHYLTFGWLAEGLVRNVTGLTLRDFVASRLGDPLGISEELLIGIGPNGYKDADIAPRLSTLVLRRESQSLPAADSQKKPLPEPSDRRRPIAPSLLLNPTFFNDPRIREASIPAANGHFSARALAKLYSSIAVNALPSTRSVEGAVFQRNGWADVLRSASAASNKQTQGEALLQGEEAKFAFGFTLFPSSQQADQSLSFGHGGVGGSVALCRIDGDDTLSVAITLNRLSVGPAAPSPTGCIVGAIYRAMDLSVPEAYAVKSSEPRMMPMQVMPASV